MRGKQFRQGDTVKLSGILGGFGLLLFSTEIATAAQRPVGQAPATATTNTSQVSNSDTARAAQLVEQGKYQEAYDLLTPLQGTRSADYNFNYLIGRAALGSGQADKAKTFFERSIESKKGWIAPHLGLGRAYFALGDYSQAKIAFETVLRFDNLPPDLLTQVEIYDKAATQYMESDRRLIGFAFIQAGAGHYWEHNTALTGASEEDDDLRKDPFYEGRAGIGLDEAVSESYLLDGSLDYRFRTFNNPVIRNDSDWRWVGQLSRTAGDSNFALGVRGRVSNRGNGYRNDYGVFGDWKYRLTASDQIGIELEVRRRAYPSGRERDLSRNIGEAWLSWTHTLSSRADFSVTANGTGQWQANIPDGNRSVAGLAGTFNIVLSKRLDAFVSPLWQHRQFNEDREHFDPVLETAAEFSRTDNEYELAGGLVWDLKRGWSVRPEFLYIKEVSNVPINDYHSTEVSVNVRKNFY